MNSTLREELENLIAKHDAMPQASWHKTDDNTLEADTPPAAYKKWENNFANDLVTLIQRKQLEAVIKELENLTAHSYLTEKSETIVRIRMRLDRLNKSLKEEHCIWGAKTSNASFDCDKSAGYGRHGRYCEKHVPDYEIEDLKESQG